MEGRAKRYTKMIALGRACQCPHQVRRITRNAAASYFDWLGTPLPGLLQVLEQGFAGCFEREDLEISADQSTVLHKRFGMSYRHLFSRLPGTELVDSTALDREYNEKRAKMDALAQRWVEMMRGDERLLFVRHDTIDEKGASLLLAALTRQAEKARVDLLTVLPSGMQWTSPDSRIHVESGIEMSGPQNWKGDDQLWDRVLQKYWHTEGNAPAARLRAQTRPMAHDAKSPVIAFQVPNEIGLGHMNRMACVALALRELDGGVRSVFVVEGSSHGVLEAMGLPCVSMPALQALRNGNGWSPWEKEDRKALVDIVADAVVESLEPDLAVYDCFPSAAFVKAAARRGIRNVLCLRKMRDFDAYMQENRVSAVLHSCEFILVPHAQEDAALPTILQDRAVYVGPIVKALPIDPTPLQIRMNLPDKRILLITAGGGGHEDTPEFLQVSLEAAALLQLKLPDLAILLVPGPLFTAWSLLNIPASIRVLPYDPLFTETCATADIVISQAGYNSAHELALLGTPTVMVPARRGFDDQFERAAQMAGQWPHIHTVADPAPDAIARVVEELLAHPQPRIRLDAPEGAYLAAAHLLRTLGRM